MSKSADEIIVKTGTCARCQARIYLIQTGQSYKWVTDPFRAVTFHCTVDPDLPVLAHNPQEETGV